MSFKRYDGFVGSAPQKKIDTELPRCPFSGENPHWLLDIQQGFSTTGVTCMCEKCHGKVYMENNGFSFGFGNDLHIVDTGAKNFNNLQLNGSYQDSETPDQNLLRGAKAIADKIDYGAILLSVRDEDLVSLEKVLAVGGYSAPNIKMSVYKNRRGRYKGVYLWCKADLGCCRIKPMFVTDYSYEMVNIDDVRIRVEEPSAF